MSQTAFAFVGAGRAPDPGAGTWRSRPARLTNEEIQAMEEEELARQERYRLWDAIDQRTRERSAGAAPLRVVAPSRPRDPTPTWTLADALAEPAEPKPKKRSRPARTGKKASARPGRAPAKARSKPAQPKGQAKRKG